MENISFFFLSPRGTKNSVKDKIIAEVCKNSPPTGVVTALKLDAKVNKTKTNTEVKDNGMTKVENHNARNISCTVKTILFLPFYSRNPSLHLKITTSQH